MAAVGILTACAPVAVAAPAIQTPDRCYIYWPGAGSQPIPLSLTGLNAGQQVRVELRVRGTTVSGLPLLTADAAGAISTRISNWTSGLRPGPTRAASSTVVLIDSSTNSELATVPVRVANAGLEIDGAAKTGDGERRWTISGISRLTGGRNYHAFYFRNGRQVGHQKLGKVGECGYLRTRTDLIPLKKVGRYELRVQASPHFRRARAWLGATVTQTRTPRR